MLSLTEMCQLNACSVWTLYNSSPAPQVPPTPVAVESAAEEGDASLAVPSPAVLPAIGALGALPAPPAEQPPVPAGAAELRAVEVLPPRAQPNEPFQNLPQVNFDCNFLGKAVLTGQLSLHTSGSATGSRRKALGCFHLWLSEAPVCC